MATQHGRDGPPAQKESRGGFAGRTSTPSDRTPRTSEQSAFYSSEFSGVRQTGIHGPSLAEANTCASGDASCGCCLTGDRSVPPRGRAAESLPTSSTTPDVPLSDGPLGYDSGWEKHYRFEVRVTFVEGPPNPDLGALVTQLLLSCPAADVIQGG